MFATKINRKSAAADASDSTFRVNFPMRFLLQISLLLLFSACGIFRKDVVAPKPVQPVSGFEFYIAGYTIGDKIDPKLLYKVGVTDGDLALTEYRYVWDNNAYFTLLGDSLIYEIKYKNIPSSDMPKWRAHINEQTELSPHYQPMPSVGDNWAFETFSWQKDQARIQLQRAKYLGKDRFGGRFMESNEWTLYYSDSQEQARMARRDI